MYNKDIACFSQDGLVNAVHCAVNTVSEPLWAWLLWLLLGVGVFFSVTTGLVQFRLFGRSLKEISGSRQDPNDPHGITSFQAFVTGLAAWARATLRAWRLPFPWAARARCFGCGWWR